jgi:FkbM family methyltransferase
VIVIDIGCARYGGDFSIERLIEEFAPSELWGFDPSAAMDDLTVELRDGGPTIHLSRKAAWTHDGEIGFEGTGLDGRVTLDPAAEKVPCFDLAAFIRSLPSDEEIVLKADVEGAEYPLLEHLIATRTDELLKLAWVEWHPPGAPVNSRPDARREAIEEAISCDLHQWNW